MPDLIAFDELHKQHREQYQILTIHDDSLKSLKELDTKLPALKEKYWQGKDLPFPILLDGQGQTEELFDIHGHPTSILIDPEGNVVGEVSPHELAAKLPPLPVSWVWAIERDTSRNVHWEYCSAKTDTIAGLRKTLQEYQVHVPVTIDEDALKAVGLIAEMPLPSIVYGGPISLRSIESLILAPHGLGIVPAADDKSLRITSKEPVPVPEIVLQRNRAIEAELDGKGIDASAMPLKLSPQSLTDALRVINGEFGTPMALDTAGIIAKTIDPKATVSGTIDPKHLRRDLNAMFKPLGLHVEVRHEVVMIMANGF